MSSDHAAGQARPLKRSNLDALDIPVPAYDRSNVTVGIVHFGVGGFHRAHQAMYLDQLMNQGEALDWGIAGMGVLPGDARMQEVMEEQDHLYTLVLKHPDGTRESRVVGSIVEYLLAVDDPDAVVEKMAHPDTKIVSLTITEGGYNFDHVTGEFVADEPGVAADLRDEQIALDEIASRPRADGSPSGTDPENPGGAA